MRACGSGISSAVTEPRPQRAEGLAVLPLVPGPAALDLVLPLGDVVRDRVPGDVREPLLRRLEVAGGAADDDAEFRLPVGTGGARRDQHGVVRADDGVRRLEEEDRLLGDRGAGLAGVVVVVEPDADDLADAGQRRAGAQPRRVQRRQSVGVVGGPAHLGQRGVGGEKGGVETWDDAGEVAEDSGPVEQGGALGTRRSDTQQFHGRTPVVARGADGTVAARPRWRPERVVRPAVCGRRRTARSCRRTGPPRKGAFNGWTSGAPRRVRRPRRRPPAPRGTARSARPPSTGCWSPRRARRRAGRNRR